MAGVLRTAGTLGVLLASVAALVLPLPARLALMLLLVALFLGVVLWMLT